jgi:hypothetical protein
VISNARFDKETDFTRKQLCQAWQKKNATMEDREVYSVVSNLINTPVCSNILDVCLKRLMI